MDAEQLLRRKLERARAEIASLEGIIETRTRELYLAQLELERRAEFLTRLFRRLPAPVFLVDADGRIRDPNPALCELVGGDPAGLEGRPWHELLVLEDRRGRDRRHGGLPGHDARHGHRAVGQ